MATSRYTYGFLHVLAAATVNAHFYDPELGVSTAFFGNGTHSNITTEAQFVQSNYAPYANNSLFANVAKGISWTVNVTDVLLPDATTHDGERILGAHAVGVTYGYSSANNRSLHDAINNSTDIGNDTSTIMCATIISTLNSNLSFSPALNDLDTHDGCSSAFGATCVDALLASLETVQDGSIGCPSLPNIANIPECNNTFGAVGPAEFMTIGRSVDMNPFYVSTTDVLPANDTTTIHDVANSLQILVMSAVSVSGMGTSVRSNMLCQRANDTYEESNGTPTPSSTGSTQPTPSSGAASVAGHIGFVAVMGVGVALLVL